MGIIIYIFLKSHEFPKFTDHIFIIVVFLSKANLWPPKAAGFFFNKFLNLILQNLESL